MLFPALSVLYCVTGLLLAQSVRLLPAADEVTADQASPAQVSFIGRERPRRAYICTIPCQLCDPRPDTKFQHNGNNHKYEADQSLGLL